MTNNEIIKAAATQKNLSAYLAADETMILCQDMLETASDCRVSPVSPLIEMLELKFDEMAASA